jgi:hypothetical protein
MRMIKMCFKVFASWLGKLQLMSIICRYFTQVINSAFGNCYTFSTDRKTVIPGRDYGKFHRHTLVKKLSRALLVKKFCSLYGTESPLLE